MPRHAAAKDMSLKALELFQICAHKGSLAAAAKDTGLTVSTVSHHLRNLEDHLGIALFNHARRPMVLTPKGRAFLRNIDGALLSLRKAKAEASAGSMSDASYLRLGTIEDFDSDIIPELAVSLSRHLPACDFLYHTDTSHAVIDMLHDRQLDLGVTTAPSERQRDLVDRPLLRDPFVIVTPRIGDQSLADVVEGKTQLPFLRFSANLIMAQQIDAQLRRIGLATPHRFECSNNQTLMALVAAQAGWTITTPLLFSRARRFQPKLQMHRFPGKSFARSLTILAAPDCSRSVMAYVDQTMRRLIRDIVLAPSHQSDPWLAQEFHLID